MGFRPLVSLAILLGILARANGQTPSPAASTTTSESSLTTAPYAERLAAAKSVKVQTDILGVSVGTSLEDARLKFSKFANAEHPPKEEGDGSEAAAEREESEHKILWELSKSDFATAFIKLDGHDRVTYVQGKFRPGKEVAFAKIGELNKAPVATPNVIAWDVVRNKRPLIRVVAEGLAQRANTLTIFQVHHRRADKD